MSKWQGEAVGDMSECKYPEPVLKKSEARKAIKTTLDGRFGYDS